MLGFAVRLLGLNLDRDLLSWFQVPRRRFVFLFGEVDLDDSLAGLEKEPFIESLGADIQSFDCP
jgi:hypothetical protein